MHREQEATILVSGDIISIKLEVISSLLLEVTIGRAGPGWAGPTVGRAKTGQGQNWPGFFGPKF